MTPLPDPRRKGPVCYHPASQVLQRSRPKCSRGLMPGLGALSRVGMSIRESHPHTIGGALEGPEPWSSSWKGRVLSKGSLHPHSPTRARTALPRPLHLLLSLAL